MLRRSLTCSPEFYSDLHHNVELFSVKGEYEIALGLEVYNKAVLDLPIEAIETAERYGYHSVWTAEAYGSDALSTLAYLAGKQQR